MFHFRFLCAYFEKSISYRVANASSCASQTKSKYSDPLNIPCRLKSENLGLVMYPRFSIRCLVALFALFALFALLLMLGCKAEPDDRPGTYRLANLVSNV